jgi:hypothetical protein
MSSIGSTASLLVPVTAFLAAGAIFYFKAAPGGAGNVVHNSPNGPTLRIFTPQELKTDSRLLLACVGHVFDVSSGEKFYGPNGPYKIFGRQDASRVFGDGKFDATENLDNIDGLLGEQLDGVIDYLKFYQNHKSYKFVGLLHGRYFNANGSPTVKYQEFLRLRTERERLKQQAQKGNSD